MFSEVTIHSSSQHNIMNSFYAYPHAYSEETDRGGLIQSVMFHLEAKDSDLSLSVKVLETLDSEGI